MAMGILEEYKCGFFAFLAQFSQNAFPPGP